MRRLLIALPTIAASLPEAMLSGVGRTRLHLTLGLPFLLAVVLFMGSVQWLCAAGKPSLAMLAAALAVLFGVAYLKGEAFPALDDRVSARGFWRNHRAAGACLDNVGRAWEYGLNYYAGLPRHACQPGETPRIAVVSGRLTMEP